MTIPLPNGLVIPDLGHIYLGGPDGPIVLLDLESGQVLAKSNFSGKPLAALEGSLVGWRPDPQIPNQLQVFSARPRNGVLELDWQSKLELPSWVDTRPAEADAFSLQGRVEGDALVLTWQARSRYPGGAPPPTDVEASQRRDQTGRIRLNLDDGSLIDQGTLALDENDIYVLPDLPPDRFMVPYQAVAGWLTQPWPVDSGRNYLVREAQTPGVLLVREQGDISGDRVEIRLSEDPGAVVSITPDGQLIFLYEPGQDQPSWNVFSARSGQKISTIPYDPGTQAVVVAGDQVLYLVVEEQGAFQHQSLGSRNLETGLLGWEFVYTQSPTGSPPPPAP